MPFSYVVLAPPSRSIARQPDGATIPADHTNADYQLFLADWQAGATVTDANGKPVSYKAPT